MKKKKIYFLRERKFRRKCTVRPQRSKWIGSACLRGVIGNKINFEPCTLPFTIPKRTATQSNPSCRNLRSKSLIYKQSIAMGTHEFFSKDSWDRFTKIFITIFFWSHSSNPWKIREISKHFNWGFTRKPSISRETIPMWQCCL
jgi:hypothetical protein